MGHSLPANAVSWANGECLRGVFPVGFETRIAKPSLRVKGVGIEEIVRRMVDGPLVYEYGRL